jgi:hypothetical protein
MIAPIETTWRGRRFRSRTEARWAVLLDAADVQFEYEREGYDLPTGWYLPDFWLPTAKTWLEIKGLDPTPREQALAAELAKATGNEVWIAVGAPDPDRTEVELFDAAGVTGVVLLDMTLGVSRSAYLKALGERFDGKPPTPPSDTKRRPFRAHGW